jgi:quercetin dioxygenase-like cupin family protein
MLTLAVELGQPLYAGANVSPNPFPQLPQFAGMFTRLGQHDDHQWEPLPWKGVYNKVLMFDRCSGLTLELAKIEKGAIFPEHYHTTVQTQFLVSGLIRLKTGEIVEPGAFNVIPCGQLHGPFEAVDEAITFKYFASVPVYILPDGATFIYKEDGTQIEAGRLSFVGKIKDRNFITSVGQRK